MSRPSGICIRTLVSSYNVGDRCAARMSGVFGPRFTALNAIILDCHTHHRMAQLKLNRKPLNWSYVDLELANTFDLKQVHICLWRRSSVIIQFDQIIETNDAEVMQMQMSTDKFINKYKWDIAVQMY